MFPGLVCQRSRILQVILCLWLHIFGQCSLQEVRGGTAKQYSRPACSHKDNHTPCPWSLCSQVKHSCEVTPDYSNRLCGRFLRFHWTWISKNNLVSVYWAHSHSCTRHWSESETCYVHFHKLSVLQEGTFHPKIKIQCQALLTWCQDKVNRHF